jgi:non-homologous end joining protein Ku
VSWNDLKKGIEINGDAVLLPKAEKKEAGLKVNGFVRFDQFDLRSGKEWYYLVPINPIAKKNTELVSDSQYTKLYNTLALQGLMVVGTIVLRTKEQPCLVLPIKNCLVLATIRQTDELVETPQIAHETTEQLAISVLDNIPAFKSDLEKQIEVSA